MVGSPCLTPGFRVNALSFSPCRLVVAVALLHIGFIIMLRSVPSTPSLSRLTMKRCWIVSKAFSTSKEVMVWFFFQSVRAVDYIYWLTHTQHPRVPGMRPTDHHRRSF